MLVSGWPWAAAVAENRPVPKTPNLLLIISDDQGYSDFGFMGNPVVRTPHIDDLANQSARFVNGYVPYSICRPSLATLLTGLYPHQNGIYFNRPYFDLPHTLENRHRANYLIRRVPTLPRLLAQTGYRTLQTGKHWEGSYANAGFDEGMTLGKPHPIEKEPAFAALGMRSGHSNGDAGLLIGRQTMQPIYDFVDRSSRAGQPFFVWYAPFLPHLPHNAPDKYLNLYEADPRIPSRLVPYYAAITWFDQTVGELLAFLQRRLLLENTLVLFLIDNGWVQDPQTPSSPVRSKNTPFEEGIRTPLLVRWDGNIQPRTHPDLVTSIDVMPTLLAAAGIPDKKQDLPGMNLLPFASGEEPMSPRAIFGEIYRGYALELERPAREVLYRWIRWGHYKYIVSAEPDEEAMLFDLERDPTELNNRAKDPVFQMVRRELQKRLDHWWNPADE